MRKKPNLIPRLEKCAHLLIDSPEEYKGRWRGSFGEYTKVRVELGCGKGRFTADCAQSEPGVLLVAIERDASALVMAMERVRDRGIDNVRFILGDVGGLKAAFSDGETDRLYINFCDPWPKSRDAKLRLTAPSFLRMYADVLAPGGEIRFKTDNAPLFDWSVERMSEELWELIDVTHDLHANGEVGIMTDYEAKFVSQGMKINSLCAVRTEHTRTTAAGTPPRLRNASLCDARGYDESRRTNERKESGE